jgi:hypothetical protein
MDIDATLARARQARAEARRIRAASRQAHAARKITQLYVLVDSEQARSADASKRRRARKSEAVESLPDKVSSRTELPDVPAE